MSAPSVFDDLPPDVLEAVAAQVAEAFAAGHAAGIERGARDAPKIYQLGYDAGVRDTEQVDPEVAAAVERLIRRYVPIPVRHRHRYAHPAGRPRFAN